MNPKNMFIHSPKQNCLLNVLKNLNNSFNLQNNESIPYNNSSISKKNEVYNFGELTCNVRIIRYDHFSYYKNKGYFRITHEFNDLNKNPIPSVGITVG